MSNKFSEETNFQYIKPILKKGKGKVQQNTHTQSPTLCSFHPLRLIVKRAIERECERMDGEEFKWPQKVVVVVVVVWKR